MRRGRGGLRRLADFFRLGAETSAPEGASILLEPSRFVEARTLVSTFYAVIFFFAIGNLYSWEAYLAASEITPRWAVFWLEHVDLRLGIGAILWFQLVAGLAAITLARYRLTRILVFLSILEFLSFKFSFGSINHGDHLGLLLSFVLIFLPEGWQTRPDPGRRVRVSTLLVFSTSQALILLTYTMSGFWKAIGVLRQALQGEVHYLHPTGLAQQVAAKLLGAESTTPLGPWLIDNYWIGWPLAIGAVYFELFALWILFRPSLHRTWGLMLIFLHVFAHLTMGIGFVRNCLWLTIFLMLSPFRPAVPNWRKIVTGLPVVGRWMGASKYREPA